MIFYLNLHILAMTENDDEMYLSAYSEQADGTYTENDMDECSITYEDEAYTIKTCSLTVAVDGYIVTVTGTIVTNEGVTFNVNLTCDNTPPAPVTHTIT